MTNWQQAIWREGTRIRTTNGTGYSDAVSDVQIRAHIDGADPGREQFIAFAEAVLAIRAYERAVAAAVVDPTPRPAADRYVMANFGAVIR